MSADPVPAEPGPKDQDAEHLRKLGYNQELQRTFGQFDNFATSLCSINVLGSLRALFYVGLLAGGPLAMWTSSLISILFVTTTASILAEICSIVPVSGSTYIWAAEAAFTQSGYKFAHLIAFIVAWWAAAGWMTFPAVYAQQASAFLLSLYSVYGTNFPGGISGDNIKWRAVEWIVAEVALLLAVIPNYLDPRWSRKLIRIAAFVLILDFVMCIIWLPIGVHKTYGFRTAKEALLTTNNGTGAPPGLNWLLSFVFAIASVSGYDSAGHVSEETRRASFNVPRGIFWSGIVSCFAALILTIFFLFCTPNIDMLLSLNAPQPFVLIYALALGRPGAVFMTALAGLSLICSTSVSILAASRLVYAIARDGPLPMGKWVSHIEGSHPYNAITVVSGFCALLLCTILPSAVAFTSLTSAGTVLVIAPYGLIALLRLTVTRRKFSQSTFPLGRFRLVIFAAAVVFYTFLFAILVSPFFFPVTGSTFNFASVLFVAVTIAGVVSWWSFRRWFNHYLTDAQNETHKQLCR